ncbi:MAG: GspE/PulE family protein [Armatimonadota bacterium]
MDQPTEDTHVLPSRARFRLGERLVEKGILGEDQIRQALEVQERSEAFLGQVVVDLGFAPSQVVGTAIAQSLGVRYIDLLKVPPDPAAVSLVPESIARALQIIPVRASDDAIEIAMVDPLDVTAIDRLHQITGRRVLPVLAMATELQRAINDFFDARTRISEALQELESEQLAIEDAARDRTEAAAGANDAPIVRLVDSIIESGLASRASDLHFEPQERGLRVRFRVDGTLVDHADIPRAQTPAVLARLKVLCTMDITESRRPQDGRLRFDNHGRHYDVRVSSVPTVFGEKLVLRILDKSSVLVPLKNLGFLPEQQATFERLIQRPHGMLLVVGPTGSGKSTTLYASLNQLNNATRNIMTLEDPVEYNIAGLNQVQVNARLGLNFAAGLRTFVRQDPDVILVGEIRDQETAEMSVQAALTGHLLLSTLHTNSAVGTIGRLANLGVDRFLIAQSIEGIVSQRLVAKVCNNCGEEYDPEESVLRALGIDPAERGTFRFRRGRGCRACHGRGYQGRKGVFEVLEITDVFRDAVLREASIEELQAIAQKGGMRSLYGSVREALRNGETTTEEMGRTVLAKES